MQDFLKIKELIIEYNKLRDLNGYTKQNRGRYLNTFLKKLLQCWGINAYESVRSEGEIDVCFDFKGKHFITEAKWEKEAIDDTPVGKLQMRVQQRLHGTIGLLLSMKGFKKSAEDAVNKGQELKVLLLSKDHLEAMLSGFIPPPDLIDGLITQASFLGKGYGSLEDLFISPKKMDIIFGIPDEFKENKLIIDSTPRFQSTVIASNLPVGSSGVTEFKRNKILITFQEGIYELDYRRNILRPFLKIHKCANNVLVTKDKSIYITRCAGVGRLKKGEFKIVGGNFSGNISLFHGKDDEVWVFSNGHFDYPEMKPSVTKLGDYLGSEERFEIDFPPSTGTNAILIEEGQFLIIGTDEISLIKPGSSKKILTKDLSNASGVASLDENRFLIFWACSSLSELDILSGEVHNIAKFRLNSCSTKLTKSSEDGGYILSHYAKSDRHKAGIIIRWHY